MKTLHINVANKIATYQKRDGEIVCGNSDYQIQFAFDNEWSTHSTKTARFIWNGRRVDVVFTGNTVNVPVIQNTEEVKVGVYAGELSTTTPAVIGCKRSILCADGLPEDPPEDVYTQILEKIDEAIANSGGGKDGTSVTVKSVSESTEDGGSNVVTFSDGKTLTVKNGRAGTPGKEGKSAYAYAQEGGYTGTEAEFAKDINPDNIANVTTNNAKTYITGDLKGDIVSQLIAELQGLPVFGTVDENNVITVTSQLSDGTYKLKYENADGTTEDIGTIVVGSGVVAIVNLLETALAPDDITTVFNGVGYKNGYYASAAEPFYNTDAAFFCSGLMPIPASGIFYIKGCTIDTSLSHTRFGLMTQSGATINTAVLGNWGETFAFAELGTQYYSVKYNRNVSGFVSEAYYFYFSASGTGEGVVVSATPIE